MYEDPVGSLLCRLYLLVCSKLSVKKGNHIAEGHKFEDETSEQIYHLALELGLEPNPPRMTLQLPTLSGNLHQFDASFRSGKNIFVIECKNTRLAAKDYVYYFNAKILDYVLAIKKGSDEFVCKVATTVEEVCKLVEAGFEYICDINDAKVFRKRK